jgi:hypothetical protein
MFRRARSAESKHAASRGALLFNLAPERNVFNNDNARFSRKKLKKLEILSRLPAQHRGWNTITLHSCSDYFSRLSITDIANVFDTTYSPPRGAHTFRGRGGARGGVVGRQGRVSTRRSDAVDELSPAPFTFCDDTSNKNSALA